VIDARPGPAQFLADLGKGYRMLATIVLLLLAAAAPSAVDLTEIETRVVEIFRSYGGPPNAPAAWDHPIYSAEVTALIARWKAVMPHDEVDSLNDGDWLCQCQDWDGEGFRATIVSIAMSDESTAEVELRVDLGFGGPESMRGEHLTLRREEGVWAIDEIVAGAFPQGLKQALRDTIAEDEALAAGKTE